MSIELVLVMTIGFIVLAIWSTVWFFNRSKSLLEQWASDNGFSIIQYQRRYFRRGPFLWTTGRGQDVYYITIQDVSGSTRSGYVRCGSLWSGLLSDQVTVEWD